MSLPEDLYKKLEVLKRAAQEYYQFVAAVDGKKQMREMDVTNLEKRIEKLKAEAEEAQNKNIAIVRDAVEKSDERMNAAKKFMDDAVLAKNKASEDQKNAQILMQQAQALMVQAQQRQKEADNQYRVYEEKKNRLLEAAKL